VAVGLASILAYVGIILGRFPWFLAFRGYNDMASCDVSLLGENPLVEKVALVRELWHDHSGSKGDHFKPNSQIM
jgi:hypothetical protein